MYVLRPCFYLYKYLAQNVRIKYSKVIAFRVAQLYSKAMYPATIVLSTVIYCT